MEPSQVGAFFIVVNITSAGALIGGFGLNQAVIRFVAESMGQGRSAKAIDVGHKALSLTILGAVFVGIVYLVSGDILADVIFQSDILVSVTGIISIWIFIVTIQRVIPEIFRGFQDLRLASLFDGALPWSLFALGLAFLVVLGEKIDLNSVLLIAAITSLLSLLLDRIAIVLQETC